MRTIEIARKYIDFAKRCTVPMQRHFGVENLLRGRREQRIPVQGRIDELNISFSFHGIGCCIETPEFTIDFDFDSNGSVGGFDAFRLAHFVNSNATSNSDRVSEVQINLDLLDLEKQGIIRRSGREPAPNSYVFSQE